MQIRKFKNIRANEKYEKVLTIRYQKKFGIDANTSSRLVSMLSSKDFDSITRKKQQIKTYRRLKNKTESQLITSLKRRHRPDTLIGQKIRRGIDDFKLNNPNQILKVSDVIKITFRNSKNGDNPLTKEEFQELLKNRTLFRAGRLTAAKLKKQNEFKTRLKEWRETNAFKQIKKFDNDKK